MYGHDRFCPTDPRAPEPVGICRRCGFKYPLSQLVDQYQWAGTGLVKVLTRVCTRTCLDEPNETLRTIVIGPDPAPIPDASPPFYSQQNAGGEAGPTSYPPLQDDGGFTNIDPGPGSILPNPGASGGPG